MIHYDPTRVVPRCLSIWAGSALAGTFPVVLYNAIVVATLLYMKHHDIKNLPQISNVGLTPIGMMLSLWLPMRLNATISGYMQARLDLANAGLEIREMSTKLVKHELKRANEVSTQQRLHSIRLLKALMKGIGYCNHFILINRFGLKYEKTLYITEIMTENGEAGGEELLTLEECGILAQSHRPLLKLFKIVSIQLNSTGVTDCDSNILALNRLWTAMDVHATTPAPFPLYQMIRVFLGCYVLAVPFVLTDDLGYYALIFVPLLTFGFWGIDFVTRQLENPYGADENDLDIGMVVADVFASIDEDFDLHHTYQSTSPIRNGGIANDKTPLV